jgi:hypothetical protein
MEMREGSTCIAHCIPDRIRRGGENRDTRVSDVGQVLDGSCHFVAYGWFRLGGED